MVASRRFRWGFIALGALAIVLFLWATLGHPKAAKPAKSATVPVTVAKATFKDVPVVVSGLGTAQAWRSVLVRPQVAGKLQTVAFKEGSFVAAGALLAEIDPAPYRAALMQVQGALDRDNALLQAARVDLTRYQMLLQQDSISRQQVDTQAALVKQDEGIVLIDQGAVATAKINLGYCRITAPLAGRVGVRLLDAGNLVTANDATGLVSVDEVTPIAVSFTVPEGDFQRLSDVSGGFTKPLSAVAVSQETGETLGSGELSIADNHVDAATGTVALKARFENPQKRLWPGQFVNVRLTLQTMAHVVVIPASAVNQGPNGAFAYVVGPDDKAHARPIVVATTQDQFAVLKSGLDPGETVVTDGQMALKSGSKVSIHTPGDTAEPKKKKKKAAS